ncbi:Exportin-4 [Irineochytrium annulatum]|nr:Exportin-4 [Irineochytrium annulatum]
MTGPQIFQAYVEIRLSLAEAEISLDEDDIRDGELKDQKLYEDQLIYMGILGRLDPAATLSMLHSCLSDRFERLKEMFHRDPHAEMAADEACRVQLIHEHLHWLVLIAAHVLADSGDGEVPVVPTSLMNLSLASGDGHDLVVLLPTLILSIFSAVTVDPGNQSLFDLCSPLLSETLISFIERWSKTYLLIRETDYKTVSPSLIRAFSLTGNGKASLEFILDMLYKSFIMWDSNGDVLEAIIDVLNVVSARTVEGCRVVESARFQDLVTYFLKEINRLPAVTHRLVQWIDGALTNTVI